MLDFTYYPLHTNQYYCMNMISFTNAGLLNVKMATEILALSLWECLTIIHSDSVVDYEKSNEQGTQK